MSNQSILPSLDENGKPPESRLQTAGQTKRLYEQCVNNNLTRSKINAKVAGAIDGNAPISQKLLESEGLGWQTNNNWRLLEADVNAAQNPYYLLYKDVPAYMCIEVDDPKYNGTDNDKFGNIIGQEMTRFLDKWKDFDFNMQLGIRNRTVEGHGNLFFRDKRDFRFSCAPVGSVYVDDETTQELGKLSFLFIYYKWKVFDLYKLIEAEGAKDAGWNIEATKNVIVRACNLAAGFTEWRKYEYWQNKIRDHDIWLYQLDPTVKTAWGYCKEFTGKITRTLVTSGEDSESEDFLFRKIGEYDRWEQIIHPFFSEIGNGHWNGVKGLGIKAYNARDTQNRLKNRIVDGAMAGASIHVYASDEKALDALQIVNQGPYTVLNKELEMAPSNVGSVLDKPMMVDSMLERDLRGNIGSQRGSMGDPQSVQPISAQQAGIEASWSNQIQLGEQTLWLNSLDNLYEEIVDRVKDKPRMASDSYPLEDWEEMVKTLHDRVKRKGVPDSVWNNIIGVKAFRSVGRGSMFIKQQTAIQSYQILKSDPNTPQQVLIKSLKAVLAALWGQEAVNNLWPDDQSQDATEDASKAQDENGTMLLGIVPIYSPDQNSFAHAATHIAFWTQQYQAVQQGQMDPAAYLKFAQPATQHVQTTLQAIQGDKTKGSQVQQIYNIFQQLVSETKGISQQYAEQQKKAQADQQAQQAAMIQAQQTGQLMDTESKLKLARIQADHQIDTMQTVAKIHSQTVKTAATIAEKTAKTRQELASKDVLVASQIRNENRKAKSKEKPAE